MLLNEKVKIGSWITLANISVAEIMADCGFDWLCLDLEHSVIDYGDLQAMIAVLQSKQVKVFVRVGENNGRIIKRVLDAGAEGIIVPSVNSFSEAKKAVSFVKYPPKGVRGVGLARAQSYGFGFENYLKNKAPKVELIVQIEHINAIAELDDILSTDGVDGTFIGPFDLSGSLGRPGDWNNEEVKKALNIYEQKARNVGKYMGYHIIEPDFRKVQDKIKLGYNFIAFSLDTLFLGSKIREELRALKMTKE